MQKYEPIVIQINISSVTSH